MRKIKSFEELKAIKEKAMSDISLRTTGEDENRIILRVGMGTCGIAAGAREIMKVLIDEISREHLDKVSVVATGCTGVCSAEPFVEVDMPGKEVIRYGNVTEAMAREIVEKHVGQGILIESAIVGREEGHRG